MTRIVRVAMGLVACCACVSAVTGQAVKPKAKVELRWLEEKPIKGVTEEKGIPAGESPGDFLYPHKKPALVLTSAEVTKAELKKNDFGGTILGVQYNVTLHLSDAARKKLAEQVKGKEMRLLTIAVDGKFWGVRRYEIDKDKKSVPEQARAETFRPDVGFFSSEAEAQRLVDAFK